MLSWLYSATLTRQQQATTVSDVNKPKGDEAELQLRTQAHRCVTHTPALEIPRENAHISARRADISQSRSWPLLVLLPWKHGMHMRETPFGVKSP